MPRTPSPHRRRRSRSPRERKRRRSRSPRDVRERRDNRDDRRERRRSADRDGRHRGRSWSRSPVDKRKKEQATKNVTAADLEGKSADEQEMMKLMGFCGFSTTKNTKVDGNDAGEVHVILKRKYRQYMNRKGGFNRPLDFVA